jgi:hypothetical protein
MKDLHIAIQKVGLFPVQKTKEAIIEVHVE